MPEEILIAVMGVTGAGKSSFIKLVTGCDDIVIGNSLDSETRAVTSYKMSWRGTNFVIVDTPGFNDTHLSDATVLEMIAQWMEKTYRTGAKLNGILYLHRLTEARMHGSSIRSLRMFKQLCGEDYIPNLVLGTTCWSLVPHNIAFQREAELKENSAFWKTLLEKGAGLVRIPDDAVAAKHLLLEMAKHQKSTLKVQKEMVDLGVSFDRLAVTVELDNDLQKLHAKQAAERQRLNDKQHKKLKDAETKLQEQRELLRKEKDSALKDARHQLVREKYRSHFNRGQSPSADLSISIAALNLEADRRNSGNTDVQEPPKPSDLDTPFGGVDIRTFDGHTRQVQCLAYSPDGQMIVSCGHDDTVRIWDAESGILIHTMSNTNRLWVTTVAFSRDSQSIVSGDIGNDIHLWNSKSGSLTHTLKGHSKSINSAQFLVDDTLLVSASDEKSLRIWDAKSGDLITMLEGHTKAINSVRVSRNGRMFASASNDGTVRVWDAESGSLLRVLDTEKYIDSVAFSPDGLRIVIGYYGGTLGLMDIESQKLIRKQKRPGKKGSIFSMNPVSTEVTFSSDGSMIVAAILDNMVYVYDGDLTCLKHKLTGHSKRVRSVAVSPDSRKIVSGGLDKSLRMWYQAVF